MPDSMLTDLLGRTDMSYSTITSSSEDFDPEEKNDAGVGFDDVGGLTEEEIQEVQQAISDQEDGYEVMSDIQDSADEIQDAVQSVESFGGSFSDLPDYAAVSIKAKLVGAIAGKDYYIQSVGMEAGETKGQTIARYAKAGILKVLEMFRKSLAFVKAASMKLWNWVTDKSGPIGKRAEEISKNLTGKMVSAGHLDLGKYRYAGMGDLLGDISISSDNLKSVIAWMGKTEAGIQKSMKIGASVSAEAKSLLQEIQRNAKRLELDTTAFRTTVVKKIETLFVAKIAKEDWSARVNPSDADSADAVVISTEDLPGEVYAGAVLRPKRTRSPSKGPIDDAATLVGRLSYYVKADDVEEITVSENLVGDVKTLSAALSAVQSMARTVGSLKSQQSDRYKKYSDAEKIASEIEVIAKDAASDSFFRDVVTVNQIHAVIVGLTKLSYRKADLLAAHSLKVCNSINSLCSRYTA